MQLELSRRYFSCQFLLNRPVFYFILHEDMEQSASPPEVMSTHQGIQPWVLDACQMSVKSALMILSCSSNGRPHRNWVDTQLLLAAYLMTIQAQLKPENSGLEREIGNVDAILDRAEEALGTSNDATVTRWTLEIMRNVRRNVAAALPNQTSPL